MAKQNLSDEDRARLARSLEEIELRVNDGMLPLYPVLRALERVANGNLDAVVDAHLAANRFSARRRQRTDTSDPVLEVIKYHYERDFRGDASLIFSEEEDSDSSRRNHSVRSDVNHIVDCDADPDCPSNCTVEEHQTGGLINLSETRLGLFLAVGQDSGCDGHEIRRQINGRGLNANVLDYLLKQPELIPKSWRSLRVCFWGTIYRYREGWQGSPGYMDQEGQLCVRCLKIDDDDERKWTLDYLFLQEEASVYRPAAVIMT
ncbi:MAG: hypothetical protein V1738_01575 [Patescibacteria group bacterium]